MDFIKINGNRRIPGMRAVAYKKCQFLRGTSVAGLLGIIVLNIISFHIGSYVRPRKLFSEVAPQKVIFGHVHIPKTAGTSVNGELAARYERVCGNKGYSFSAYQENSRRNNDAFKNQRLRHLKNSTDDIFRLFTAGIYAKVLTQIGFEDCDYVSHETKWSFWPEHFAEWDLPLELHVPCRDPISHLMSMCNYKDVQFNCNAEPISETLKCIFGMQKFSKRLVEDYQNIFVKCFNAEKVADYIQYMDGHLQSKRKPAKYVFRKTNKDRNIETECIWANPNLQSQIKQYMISNFDYYSYCDACLNSSNDLLSL